MTFREIDEVSHRLAQYFAERGISKGDAVLILIPMSISLYACLLALFRAGATAVILDPSAGAGHIGACCAMKPLRGFIGTWKAHLLRLLVPELRSVPVAIRLSGDPACLPRPSGAVRFDEPELAPETPALITFTSGSTGLPKAAVRTHGFLIAQHRALAEALGLRAGEKDLSTLPVFVLANLASGVTSILPDSDMRRPAMVNAARIAAQIARHGPDRTAGSPAFYLRMLSHDNGKALSSFRKIYTGGAPVFPSTLERLQAAVAPGGSAIAVYGSTEAEPIAHSAWNELAPHDLEATRNGKGLPAGIPVPQVQLAIVQEDAAEKMTAASRAAQATPCDGPLHLTSAAFSEMKAATGSPGEIWDSGDNVLRGYLNGKGDSETKCSVEGTIWHRTGDSGYLDCRGRLWLLGRGAARVRDSAGDLYPFAVECVAMTFSFVRRCALTSFAQKRVLAVEYARPAGQHELVGLSSSLKWARIDKVIELPGIPVDKRHNAKVDYPALHKLLSSVIGEK